MLKSVARNLFLVVTEGSVYYDYFKSISGEAATSRDPLESTSTVAVIDDEVEPSGESRIIPDPSSLTMESLKEMVQRPLSSEEQSHVI